MGGRKLPIEMKIHRYLTSGGRGRKSKIRREMKMCWFVPRGSKGRRTFLKEMKVSGSRTRRTSSGQGSGARGKQQQRIDAVDTC
jgi:hypothetical protein